MKKEFLPYYYQSKEAKIKFPDGKLWPIYSRTFYATEFNDHFELYLRQITDITFKEAVTIAKLSFGLENHNYPLSDYQCKINLTTIEVYINNDHYCKTLLIGKSGNNIWNLNGRLTESSKTSSVERTHNTSKIFNYMIKECGFDIFELIHNNHAHSIEKDLNNKDDGPTNDIKLTEEFQTIWEK